MEALPHPHCWSVLTTSLCPLPPQILLGPWLLSRVHLTFTSLPVLQLTQSLELVLCIKTRLVSLNEVTIDLVQHFLDGEMAPSVILAVTPSVLPILSCLDSLTDTSNLLLATLSLSDVPVRPLETNHLSASVSLPTASAMPHSVPVVIGQPGPNGCYQEMFKDFVFDVPAPDSPGPFYLVTQGKHVGIFSGW